MITALSIFEFSTRSAVPYATDAKVAPPDEPTALDLDHVKRAKFSPPHEPADTSLADVPSLVDGNFLPAWI